jgi:L-threonylcarbamoyladenylate synthase
MSLALDTRVMKGDRAGIAAAARCLAEGGLVAFPTETVYGLGADATNGEAIARLYAAKGRPSFNPLIAHVADAEAARRLAVFNAAATRLATLWPGPLTLVLPKSPGNDVADLATAGLETIALRVPRHRIAHDMIVASGKPIVAPSANRSGHVSPTTAEHVRADLAGRIDLIIDDGPTMVGLESTIVACLGAAPALLRPGGIPHAVLEKTLGAPIAPASLALAGDEAPLAPARVVAPGQFASHYAPRARLRLDAEDVRAGEALLAFGAGLVPGASQASAVRNLSAGGDVMEAAANLFSHLRALDAAGAGTIAVMPVPETGLGEAINDRLRRAAAPR